MTARPLGRVTGTSFEKFDLDPPPPARRLSDAARGKAGLPAVRGGGPAVENLALDRHPIPGAAVVHRRTARGPHGWGIRGGSPRAGPRGSRPAEPRSRAHGARRTGGRQRKNPFLGTFVLDPAPIAAAVPGLSGGGRRPVGLRSDPGDQGVRLAADAVASRRGRPGPARAPTGTARPPGGGSRDPRSPSVSSVSSVSSVRPFRFFRFFGFFVDRPEGRVRPGGVRGDFPGRRHSRRARPRSDDPAAGSGGWRRRASTEGPGQWFHRRQPSDTARPFRRISEVRARRGARRDPVRSRPSGRSALYGWRLPIVIPDQLRSSTYRR